MYWLILWDHHLDILQRTLLWLVLQRASSKELLKKLVRSETFFDFIKQKTVPGPKAS